MALRWQCQHCNGVNEPTATTCWNCYRDRPTTEDGEN